MSSNIVTNISKYNMLSWIWALIPPFQVSSYNYLPLNKNTKFQNIKPLVLPDLRFQFWSRKFINFIKKNTNKYVKMWVCILFFCLMAQAEPTKWQILLG